MQNKNEMKGVRDHLPWVAPTIREAAEKKIPHLLCPHIEDMFYDEIEDPQDQKKCTRRLRSTGSVDIWTHKPADILIANERFAAKRLVDVIVFAHGDDRPIVRNPKLKPATRHRASLPPSMISYNFPIRRFTVSVIFLDTVAVPDEVEDPLPADDPEDDCVVVCMTLPVETTPPQPPLLSMDQPLDEEAMAHQDALNRAAYLQAKYTQTQAQEVKTPPAPTPAAPPTPSTIQPTQPRLRARRTPIRIEPTRPLVTVLESPEAGIHAIHRHEWAPEAAEVEAKEKEKEKTAATEEQESKKEPKSEELQTQKLNNILDAPPPPSRNFRIAGVLFTVLTLVVLGSLVWMGGVWVPGIKDEFDGALKHGVRMFGKFP